MADYNIPMSAGPQGAAAGLDTSAPRNPIGAQIPMNVKPFTPIDVADDTMKAYKLADVQSKYQADQVARLDQTQKIESAQRDQSLLSAFTKSGHGLHTDTDITIALQDLGDKLSPQTVENLEQQRDAFKANKAKTMEMAAKLPTDVLASLHDSAVAFWEQTRSMTDEAEMAVKQNPNNAQQITQDYKAKKAALFQTFRGQVNPLTGQPMYDPAMLDTVQNADIESSKSALARTKIGIDMFKEVRANSLTQSTIDKNNASAEAERALAKQRGEGKAESTLGKLDDDLKNGRISQEEHDKEVSKLTSISAPGLGVPEGEVTPEERKLAVNQWIQNPSSMRGMDKTYQRNVIKWAADLGITSDDVLSGRAGQKFDMSSATASGHRAGVMATVEKTMPGLIKNAEEASAKVDRGSFVPWTKLMQMGDAAVSDPDLKDLKLANQALESEYQQVISRGGSNVTSLKAAMELLQTADSPETYSHALRMVEKEVKANKEGSEGVRTELGTGARDKLAAGFPKVAPGEQKGRDNDAVAILQGELTAKQAELQKAATEEDKHRVQQDIEALNREIKVKGGTAAKPAAKSTPHTSEELAAAKDWLAKHPNDPDAAKVKKYINE